MKVKKIKMKKYLEGKDPSFEDDLFEGLRETGFVILEDHGISNDLLNKVYDTSKNYFSKEKVEKDNDISEVYKFQRGYIPYKTEHAKDSNLMDLKEFYQVGIDRNNYPSKEFKEVVEDLYSQLEKNAKIMLKALTKNLKLEEDYFDKMTDKGDSILRLLHYPPIGNNEDPNAIRAAEHEDINLITLLVAAEGKGLQILTREGDWIDVETKKGEIVVDVGDMLSRITNNLLPSTTHRVVNGDQKENSRYSMPFFCHPNPEAILSVIDHLKDGNEEQDIKANDFLNQRLREIGLKK
tara:strand:+ start:3042 stop:3923 length:882 start_codon:yes stop_codon:yes gene_type:complete